MGRAPCCDKANVKKGPWSPEEDSKLKSYIEQHGTGGNWIALPQKIGLKRCGKSCRLRWLNYLRPNIKHGGFSEEEDNIICSLYVSIGSRWSVIAAQLPGRTDNDIKNYWNTKLKKKLLGNSKHRKDQQSRCKSKLQEGANNNRIITSPNSLLVPENSSTNTMFPQPYYWPLMPVISSSSSPLQYPSLSNQDPCFNDQDSIKRLLIKLGGRFSDEDDHGYYHPSLDALNSNPSNNLLLPDIGTPSCTQVACEEQANMASSSSSCILSNNNQIELMAKETGGLEEIVCNINNNDTYAYPLSSDGLELLFGEDMMMVNDKIAPAANTNSLIYESFVPSNYQGMPQQCALPELGYNGQP